MRVFFVEFWVRREREEDEDIADVVRRWCLEIGSSFSLVSKLCAYGLADFYTRILIPSLTKRVV